ncbi:MAG: hypothetical protein KGI80_04040 [Verrucomicrobiota bacterium]|nr:hypothetical protein [Verrucomicrobiota bacterium]
MRVLDSLPALSPAQFFGVVARCFYVEGRVEKKKKWFLPSMADLFAEEEFAQVFVGWNEEALSFFIDVDAPFVDAETDYVDLFLDTRDRKKKGVVSRFCHHFRFSAEGGKEMTRFRGEDMHPLALAEDLECRAECKRKSYTLAIAIPTHSLHGYDPLLFARLGFTYSIHRTEEAPLHFSVSSLEYGIGDHPATWGSLHLVR